MQSQQRQHLNSGREQEGPMQAREGTYTGRGGALAQYGSWLAGAPAKVVIPLHDTCSDF